MIDLYTDEYFMEEALKQAHIGFEEGEIPVGAVVVCNNRIVARAYNQTEKLTDVTAHAEMLALTSASNYLGSKYLPECRLFVTLEPCVMCAGATFWAQLGELNFAANDPNRGYSRIQPTILHPKTVVKQGIMADASRRILLEFFKNLRK